MDGCYWSALLWSSWLLPDYGINKKVQITSKSSRWRLSRWLLAWRRSTRSTELIWYVLLLPMSICKLPMCFSVQITCSAKQLTMQYIYIFCVLSSVEIDFCRITLDWWLLAIPITLKSECAVISRPVFYLKIIMVIDHYLSLYILDHFWFWITYFIFLYHFNVYACGSY